MVCSIICCSPELVVVRLPRRAASRRTKLMVSWSGGKSSDSDFVAYQPGGTARRDEG